jgi:hypothetical protein
LRDELIIGGETMTPSRSATVPSPKWQTRKHDRFSINVPGILRVPQIRGGVYLITVLDVSKTGLRLSCPSPLPIDTQVEINFLRSRVFGVTKYARPVDGGFNIGIEANGFETTPQPPPADELDLTVLIPKKSLGNAKM